MEEEGKKKEEGGVRGLKETSYARVTKEKLVLKAET